MKIEYVGKNYEVSDRLKEISEKKIKKLLKYFDEDATSVRFQISRTGSGYVTELTVSDAKSTVRAECESESPYDNVDLVIPKIEGQMRKERALKEKKLRDGIADEDTADGDDENA